MKQFLLASSIVFALGLIGCTQNGPGSTNGSSGGSSVAGSGGTTAAAGNSGNTGGAGISSGGAVGSGGTSNNSGGAVGSGGTSNNSGGAIGSGGSGGGAIGSGGANGTGGSAGGGGASTGTGGRGGASGTGGTIGGGTGGGALNVADVVPTGFDGFYWEATPSGNTALSGTNYPFGPSAGGCPSGSTWDTTGYNNAKTMTMKGTPGTPYTVHINVRGVSGTRCYNGGTPGPGATTNPNASGPNNTWYIGGKQYNDSIWNTYELHVNNVPTGKPTVYFFNAFPNISNWCQKEATYEVKYDASFEALGGATLTLNIHDSNCRTLANCGAVENQPSCDSSAARVIDMAGVSPAPMNFTQPRTASVGGSTYYVQWLWIDVTSVTSP